MVDEEEERGEERRESERETEREREVLLSRHGNHSKCKYKNRNR